LASVPTWFKKERYVHRVPWEQRRNRGGRGVSALSVGAYTTALLVMVDKE
jgi:hypothetical protein